MDDKKILLRMLYKASPKLRRALLADLPPEVIRLLSECALNILKGTVTLKNKHKAKLRRHRKNLRILAQKRAPVATKKRVVQTGGFLPALLGALAPMFLGPVVGPIVKNIAGSL